MRIQVRYNGIEVSPTLRRHIEKHVRFALGRFRPHVPRVLVLLSRAPGRQMHDKECSILMETVGQHPVAVRQIESDIFAAVTRAAQRAGRALGRRMSIDDCAAVRSIEYKRTP